MKIFNVLSTAVLPIAAFACILIWLLLLQSLPRQAHCDMFINVSMGFCCPHLPILSVASALSCSVHDHEQWQNHDHVFHPAPRISHDHFAHYLNSACSHLLLLIAHPMPALPVLQHSLAPHLKVHQTHNCTTGGWAAITAQLSSSTLALCG